jgi:serine/threonine-protein kinase
MRRCSTCHRTYSDDTLNYCLDDGSLLGQPYDPEATQRMPPTRPTQPPPTEVLPYSTLQRQPPQRSYAWLVYVSAAALVMSLIIGGGLIGWLSLRNKDARTQESSAPSPSQVSTKQSSDLKDSKNNAENRGSPETEEGSPAQRLVGVWRANVNELGTSTAITYTFKSDGTSRALFKTPRGTGTDQGTWRYSDGILHERFSNGASGKGSIRWIDDDTFEITIIDNGVPAYSGLKRIYHRAS